MRHTAVYLLTCRVSRQVPRSEDCVASAQAAAISHIKRPVPMVAQLISVAPVGPPKYPKTKQTRLNNQNTVTGAAQLLPQRCRTAPNGGANKVCKSLSIPLTKTLFLLIRCY